jgi:hypothetical protein
LWQSTRFQKFLRVLKRACGVPELASRALQLFRDDRDLALAFVVFLPESMRASYVRALDVTARLADARTQTLLRLRADGTGAGGAAGESEPAAAAAVGARGGGARGAEEDGGRGGGQGWGGGGGEAGAGRDLRLRGGTVFEVVWRGGVYAWVSCRK